MNENLNKILEALENNDMMSPETKKFLRDTFIEQSNKLDGDVTDLIDSIKNYGQEMRIHLNEQ
jgi:hypothetical protein